MNLYRMKKTIHADFTYLEPKFDFLLENFKNSGELVGFGKRNVIKIFKLDNLDINIKSFKKPNFFNKIIYTYFRKSKARRSFEFANILLQKGIGTPKPMAFMEEFDLVGLTNSYYICEHIASDLTYRELVDVPDFPDHENILRQFTAFSFQLHELGIEFKDHSPGNTLIKKLENGLYSFYLVDLNRMNFHENMSFDLRMKNLSRLTHKPEMVAIMSEEYAKFYDKPASEINAKMWSFTAAFQKKFHQRQRFKQKMKK